MLFLSVDWVYFKATKDCLRYAVKFPSVDLIETVNAESSCFEQQPSYQSGVRISGALPSACAKWKIAGSWLNFRSSPPQIHVKSPNFGLVANYAVPVFGILILLEQLPSWVNGSFM